MMTLLDIYPDVETGDACTFADRSVDFFLCEGLR